MNYIHTIKTIKRFSIIAIMITTNSYAAMDLDLSGGFQFISGDVFSLEKNQNNKKRDLRAPRFITKGHISAKGKHKIDELSSAGLNINILTTAKPSFNNGTYIYYDSKKFGRLELGSMKDAGRKMQISSLSVATSSAWKYFALLEDSGYPNASFITDTKVFINKDSKNHEYSRKLSYFTPKFGDKIQFGISYIPDSENIGGGLLNASHPNNYEYKLDDGSVATISTSVKNAICYGVSYESNISDGIDLKIALTGKYASPVKKASINDATGKIREVDIAPFNSYNIGAIMTRGNFSYATSYGNLNKSLTAETIQGKNRDSYWFGFGIGYDQGPVGAAINYYQSNHLANQLSLISFSTDYQIFKGLKTFFEVSQFNAPFNGNGLPEKQNKGYVFLLGIKASF